MDKDEKKAKKQTDKLVEIVCRTERRCQERDCTKCEYSQFGGKCYPMMLARAMRCSGVQVKGENMENETERIMHYRKRRSGEESAIKIAVALVADYANREAAVKAARAAGMAETQLEAFDATNRMIDECLQCIEPYLRDILREDIAERTGWENSKAHDIIAKDVYYSRKNQVIDKLLKNFNLVLDT